MVVESRVIYRFESFVLGFCKCGCNKEMNTIRRSHYIKRYIKGHNRRGYIEENHPNWKGGRIITTYERYIIRKAEDGHPQGKYVMEHRLVYEEYLSILFDEDVYIPRDHHIHHLDGNRENNTLANLTILSASKHATLHKTGNTNRLGKRLLGVHKVIHSIHP